MFDDERSVYYSTKEFGTLAIVYFVASFLLSLGGE